MTTLSICFSLISTYVLYLTVQSWYLYSHIPTIGGPSYPLFSYIGSIRFLLRGSSLMREGCTRYRGKIFKIALFDRWLAVVTDSSLVDELRKLPEDDMSLRDAASETLAARYSFGKEVTEDTWHVELVRTQLTRNLGLQFDDLRDEIVASFDEYISCTDDGEWIAMPGMDLVRKVACRVINRAFIGLPKCRDQDWIDINNTFGKEVMKARVILGCFPSFLKPLASRFLTCIPSMVTRATRHLEPMILERRGRMEEEGKNYPGKPKDLLSSLLDSAKGDPQNSSTRSLTIRMLSLNLAAFHTTSNVFLDTLFDLAVRPQYMAPLREEIEAVVQAHGWSKVATDKMVKLDSFIKESLRYNNTVGFSVMRIAKKKHTFTDGTTIPVGTFVVAAPTTVHRDEDAYPHADEFLPFRFSDIRGKTVEGVSQQLSATSLTWLSFGHGQRACPGRVFASVKLKALIGHVVTSYDLRTEAEGVRPSGFHVGSSHLPDPRAKILFRKRQQ